MDDKVQKDGQRKAFYCSTPGKKGKIEAEKKADKWLDKVERNQKNIRFEDAWAEYLGEVELLKGTGTYKQTKTIGKIWLLPKLSKKLVSDISDYDWQRCINDGYKAGLSKKTLSNIRGRIYNFCKFAKKARYLKDMPFNLEIPNDAHVVERHILQPDALIKLFCEDTEIWRREPRKARYIYAFRFAVVTGLRRGELCGLMWADIKDGFVYVNRAYNEYGEFTKGKNDNAKRRFKINAIAEEILADQKEISKVRELFPLMFLRQRMEPL